MPPYWAAARVQPQRGEFAAEHLEARGFKVFLPKIETRRTAQALFRGYAFVMIVDRWRAIESTFGVLALIRFGDAPARCPDAEIAALKARADDNGIIRLPPEPPKHAFKKGDRVRILAGRFASFDAIHSGMSVRQREFVLLKILGSTRTVQVASHHLIAAS